MDFCLENIETGHWEWIEFPTSIEKVRERLGLKDAEFHVIDTNTPIHRSLFEKLTVPQLNAFVERMQDIDSSHDPLLEYFIEHYDGLLNFIEEFSYADFTIVEASKNKDLGVYLVDAGLWYSVSGDVYPYLDFEAIGRDAQMEGSFSKIEGYFVRGY